MEIHILAWDRHEDVAGLVKLLLSLNDTIITLLAFSISIFYCELFTQVMICLFLPFI